MAHASSPRIHPTAVISPEAELADDVQVGPYVVIEGKVRIGPGCVLRPYVHLIGPLTMGGNNLVYSGAVLGERPQHLRFNNDEPTGVEIGDHNIFREYVTVHRGTTHSWMTRVGSHNFFMANSHIAHDCQVGSHCLFANGALLGGHCIVENNVYLSGNSAVHQFVRLGRLSLLSGCSTTTKDILPFMMQQGSNTVVGVNVVGMRRAGLSVAQIDAVRHAFRIIYREGKTLPAAMAKIEQEMETIDVAAELIAFIRGTERGVNSSMRQRNREAA